MSPSSIVRDDRADGRIVTLTLPGGTLTASACRALVDQAEDLRENRSVRAVVLTADGDDFCTGTEAGFDPYDFRPDPASALAALRPPVVVGVSGACRAEGFELVLAADVRVAGPDTRLALPQAAEGRVPAWGGTQRLPRAIAPGRAMMLALLADEIAADDARSIGLVHDVADEPAGEALRLAEALAERGPLALELAKEAVHRGSELPLRDGLRLEGDLNHQLAATEDRAEGLAAFFEKRPPDFSGR